MTFRENSHGDVRAAHDTTLDSGEDTPTTPVRSLLNGQVADADIDALELVSARRALALLHERIPSEDMERYLAEDVARADSQWRSWADQSNGEWRPCLVDFEVRGISQEDFVAWWSSATSDLQGVLYPGYPEHYLFSWETSREGHPHLQVLEEFGHVPFRMYCSYGPEWVVDGPAPGYEIVSAGVGRLRDGTQVTRFLTQARQESGVLHIKTGLYLIAGAPARVAAAHRDQILVEWTRWLQMALKEASGGAKRVREF